MASSWVETPGRGIAKYPFTANDANQLTLKVGDILEVKQENGGWFRGYLVGGPPTLRLFPKSYVSFTPQYELDAEAPPPPPDSPSPHQTPITSPRGAGDQQQSIAATYGSSSPQMQGMTPQQQQQHHAIQPLSMQQGYPQQSLQSRYNTMRLANQQQAATIIPVYNPESKPKAVVAPVQPAVTAPPVFIPTIHSDFKDQDHGYFLLKSPNQSPYNPELSNILEVVDGHRVVDPITSQDILIDERNIPLRQLTENSNDPLIQLRHAQHQSLTLAIEPALRDEQSGGMSSAPSGAASPVLGASSIRNSLTVSSSSTKKKTAESLNVATPEVVRAVYPPLNTDQLHGAGDNSLPPKRYQLFLQVNVCIFSVNEWTELFFSLYSASKGSYVSEDYVVRLPPPGLPEHGTILGRMKTLFRDIDPADLKSDLWLVCRIYRIGSLLMDKKEVKKKDDKKTPEQLSRRAFGCAATFISDANLHLQLGRKYEPPPNQLTIYVPAVEHLFPRFHDMLIQRAKGKIRQDSRDFETVPKAKGIALCLTLYQGEANQVREQNRSLLRDVTDTLKIRPPLFWDIRQTRSDVYVTLNELFAIQDKKASPRNIEVRITLINKYSEVPNALYRGSGEEPVTTYVTSIYYHSNNPSFGETFKIRAPANVLSESHLYFELWHISSNPKKSGLFSVAVMPLTTDTGSFLENTEHTITTCKPFPRDEAYLSDLYKSRMQYRKGETIRLSTQLVSTSLTPSPVLTSLSTWRITSRQILTTNLQSLMQNKMVNVDGHELRRNFKEIIHILLAILASNSHVEVHVTAIEALMFVLSRLAQDAVPMLDTFCQYLVADVAAYNKLLGYILGTLANHTENVLQAVSVANSSSSSGGSGSMSPTNAGDQRPSHAGSPPSTPASPSHARSGFGGIPSTPGGSLGAGRSLNFDDAGDFNSLNTTTHNALVSSTSTGNLGGGAAALAAAQQDVLGTGGADHPPFIRFALALPFLIRLVASVYSIHERKGYRNASLQQLSPTARPTVTGSLPSTMVLHIESDISREEFKKHINTIFGNIHAILEQHLQPEKHRLIQLAQVLLLKAYPTLLMSLTIHESDTASLCGVFTVSEAQELIRTVLISTANHPSLALDQLQSVQIFLTGISGMLQPPLEIQNSVLQQHGWHRHMTTFARSWLYVPRSLRSRLLRTSQIKALLPQFITTITDAVTISLKRASLSETYSAVIIAQHLYSMVFAHVYRTQADVEASAVAKSAAVKSSVSDGASTATLTKVFNPSDTAYCFDFLQMYPIVEASDGEGDDAAATATAGQEGATPPPASKATAAVRFAFTDLLPLLPCLVNALTYYISSYPCLETPKIDTTLQTTFNLLEPRVANTAHVDFLPDLSILVFGFIRQVSSDEFMRFIKDLPVEGTSQFIQRLLYVANTLVNYRIFPSDWITLEMYQMSSIVYILRLTARVLREKFLGLHFNSHIWVLWFRLGLECKQSPLLITELQPLVRKVFIAEQYGSLRDGLGELFSSMWNDLDKRSQRSCIPTFVESLLSYACNSVVTDVKTTSLEMYFDLLKAEYASEGTFNECERCTIDACYEITNTSPERGSIATALLIQSVGDKLDAVEDDALKQDGLKFLTHLDNLFSLMSSLFNFPEDPAYESDRTSVALRLIRYIERTEHDSSSRNSTGRKAMHSRYIQYLVDLHIKNGNFIEAGITLVQQAKLLDWTHTIMDSHGDHPMETETLRKERLLKLAISSFAKAQDFERCISIIDYLRYYYQMITYDYKSLSSLIQQQALYFQQILSTTRVYCKYYRVVFYGDFDHAQFERGTEYVYRGNLLESVMDFTTRLKARYQETFFHMSTDRPSEELLAQHKRIISIGSLTVPTVEQRKEILRQSRGKATPKENNTMISWKFAPGTPLDSTTALLTHSRPTDAPEHTHSSEPSATASYRDNNDVCVFEYSRPWRRTEEKNPSNEFKHLWLIRNFVIVEESFPSNRRRIPVIERVEKIMKPIECAVETINNKSRELGVIMAEVNQTPFDEKADVRTLSMTLNGMIDAAVNGGNAKYIEAFLTPEFTSPESVTLEDELADVQQTLAERRHYQEELKNALKYQLEILQDGLLVYGQKGDKSQLGLYEHLIDMHNKSRTTMAAILD